MEIQRQLPQIHSYFINEPVKLIWDSGFVPTSMSLPYKPYLSRTPIGESQLLKYASQIMPTPYWNLVLNLLALSQQVVQVISTGDVNDGINLESVSSQFWIFEKVAIDLPVPK